MHYNKLGYLMFMEELFLLRKLKEGDPEAFSFLFKSYYKDLVLFGGTFVSNQSVCEDIVQTVFLKLWKERATLQIVTSLKSYLMKAVRNSCLDELRHEAVVRAHASYTHSFHMFTDIDTENYILYSDLYTHLHEALQKIPAEYRTTFEMNRFEGLKYKEIAEQLQISERTVEVRIAKTIKLLKEHLKDFLLIFLHIFFNI